MLTTPHIIKFSSLPLPATPVIAVMAPHPDDFDAIAITLKRLVADSGAKLHLAVMTGGASGVEDQFAARINKATLREVEQLTSCHRFGLDDSAITFMRLTEKTDGDVLSDNNNISHITTYLIKLKPQLIFMPYGNDSNATHRDCLTMVSTVVRQLQLKVQFILNMDPKTRAMAPNCYSGFSPDEAAWKGKLLRCHTSQQQRNLNQRQHGFDERILNFNRQGAKKFHLPEPYAELFVITDTP